MKTPPEFPTEEEYDEAMIELALSRVRINPCADCGWPVLHGYCCTYCDSTDPSRRERE